MPTARHMTTAQLVNIHDKMFLVDCGEGTQTQIWKSGIKVTNMNHIFISHAHGDHFFGLIPLLSSMRLMLERTDSVHVYVPEGLKESLEVLLKTWCYLSFPVKKPHNQFTIKETTSSETTVSEPQRYIFFFS